MRIVSIVSSGRKNGNTHRIAGYIEDELKRIAEANNTALQIEHVYLGSADINFCRGCRLCFDRGEDACPFKDELLSIRDIINKADGVILGSPVYVEDINGVMKNWIDRMAFNCHRPAFGGKTSLILTTSGVGSTDHALKTMASALRTWGFNISAMEKFRTGGLMKDEEIIDRYSRKIKLSAEKLFEAANSSKAKNPSFYSLIYFKVQQRYWQKNESQRGTFDYKYWENKGWLEDDCSYYIDNKANPMKLKAAGLMGSLVAKFFA